MNQQLEGNFNTDIPTVAGNPGDTFFNLSNFIYYGMLSLTSLILNNTISDVPVEDIHCTNYIKPDLSYPLQSPKSWPELNLPGGTWKQTCDIYIWLGLANGNYSGSWDNGTLTVQCAPITTWPNGEPTCVEFGSDTPVEMSIAYSAICNSGSDVSAQYMPTLNGQTEAPMAYGYCSSVNMNYYNDSANYTNIVSQTTGYAPSTSCSGDGTHVSGCDSCQWGIYFNPNGYFQFGANTFPAACSWTSNSFGLWASRTFCWLSESIKSNPVIG